MPRRLVFLAALLLPGCFNAITLVPSNYSGPVEELVVKDAKHFLCRDKIAIIDVDGVILNAQSGGFMGSGENPVALFRERLEAAADDKKVKAVVLRINSPGGGVTASDIMYQDLLRFRAATGKPVVACMMDVAASGGCYLAMGCDRIYAHPTTVTGSIGVIMSLYNASGLLTKIGVKSDPIKSGPNKDIGNPAKELTEEQRVIFQGIVDRYYDRFVQVVVEGRRLPEERVRLLADGRIYTGDEARELGLVDDVGYLEDAIRAAKDLACVKDARIVAYDRGCGYRGCIYSALPKIPSEITVKLDVPGLHGPTGAAFLYMWEPGTIP